MKKIFAIGDIHGCYDQLKALVEKIPIDFSRDTLLFIGDYIDRGPHSAEVVDYLIQLKKRVKEVIFLKGNHEDMLDMIEVIPGVYGLTPEINSENEFISLSFKVDKNMDLSQILRF